MEAWLFRLISFFGFLQSSVISFQFNFPHYYSYFLLFCSLVCVDFTHSLLLTYNPSIIVAFSVTSALVILLTLVFLVCFWFFSFFLLSLTFILIIMETLLIRLFLFLWLLCCLVCVAFVRILISSHCVDEVIFSFITNILDFWSTLVLLVFFHFLIWFSYIFIAYSFFCVLLFIDDSW